MGREPFAGIGPILLGPNPAQVSSYLHCLQGAWDGVDAGSSKWEPRPTFDWRRDGVSIGTEGAVYELVDIPPDRYELRGWMYAFSGTRVAGACWTGSYHSYYLPTGADNGKWISCVVTVTNSVGSVSVVAETPNWGHGVVLPPP